MARSIDYYLTAASPYVYLGHAAFVDMARRHGSSVNVKPVSLAGVWEVSGAVPLARRPPVRQRYRLVELQRLAEWRGLPINIAPRHFPTDPTLADHTIIALVRLGIDPLPYMGAVFSALWAGEADIASNATLLRLLEEAGHDSAAVMAAAQAIETAEIRRGNTQDAIAADAVGVPVYVLDGEPFWGQDRLELLDRMLVSGRPPFRPQT